MKWETISNLNISKPQNVEDLGDDIDSLFLKGQKPDTIVAKLKKCRTEEDIDALFSKYEIQNFKMRNNLLRWAMNCSIVNANVTSPRMKRENLSPEDLEKRYYQTEKRTFLSISGFYDAIREAE